MSISKNKTYNIYNKTTDELLSEKVLGTDVRIVESALVEIGYKVVIKETAAGGSTGAGSIAVNMDAKKHSIKEFMKSFQAKIKNIASKPMYITVTEGFDMESVFSRLSSMEKAGSTKKTEGTTFGVEDDQGNLMKVTVRSDQAKAFEDEIAKYLADIKTGVVGMPPSKGATEVSIAELLFKLKDNFDIIDVDFPKIPTDVVYNADKASPAGQVDPNLVAAGGEGDLGDMDDGSMGDEFGAEGGEGEDPNAPLDLTDYKQSEEGGDEADIDLDNPEGMEGMDDESVEDFGEEPADQEGSILNQVIDMLKAQAEAATAEANARAEQARADQARYATQASQQAVKDQEESLRYELEMEQQKKAQKEADKMADMAKHKMSKAMGMREGLNEMDIGSEPSNMIQKERQAINAQFEILPDDDADAKMYKTKQRAEALRMLGSRYRIAVNRERYEAVLKAKGKQQQPQQNNPNPNPQPQQQQQGQQQTQQQGQQQQSRV